MKPLNTIFVDLNNTDIQQRVRLNTVGALHDIKTKGILLEEGLELILDDRQEFTVRGIAKFSKEENI
jgi:hypothetical protein